MPVMAAVVQIAINLKMPRISHPMNHLDHWSSLVSNQEASPGMGPSSQGHWWFIGNHRLRRDWRIKRESFLKEIEELRQVSNFQFIQVTERKVLMNSVSCIYNKKKWNTGLHELWLIIAKEIITMTLIGPCKMSSLSPKFFSACSKFPDVHCLGPICLSRTIWGWEGVISSSSQLRSPFHGSVSLNCW